MEDVGRVLFLSEDFYTYHVFKIGCGILITIKEVIESIYKILNKKQKIPFGTSTLREDQNRYLQADMTKFFSQFRWSPAMSLDKGITTTIDSARLQLLGISTIESTCKF